MSEIVAVSQMQPKDGHREELIALLRELSAEIQAEEGGLHYSVHAPLEEPDGPLTVIQAYASLDAFRAHSAWMRPNVPRLAGLLASAPHPPLLLGSLSLGDSPKERFAAAA